MRRSPMDAASIQPYWSRSSLLEQHGQKFLSISRTRCLSGCAGLQAVQSREQEQKRKNLGKEIGMMRTRRTSGMKLVRWILLWILIGVKMRMVEAAEEGSLSAPRNGAQDRDTSRTPPQRGKQGKMEEEERQ